MTHSVMEHKLLVDWETGRVLRGDDSPSISRRMTQNHPFIEVADDVLFVGPDARRRAIARQRGEGELGLGADEYEIRAEVDGVLQLQRVQR